MLSSWSYRRDLGDGKSGDRSPLKYHCYLIRDNVSILLGAKVQQAARNASKSKHCLWVHGSPNHGKKKIQGDMLEITVLKEPILRLVQAASNRGSPRPSTAAAPSLEKQKISRMALTMNMTRYVLVVNRYQQFQFEQTI
jgi:hypothetical protein